MHDSDVNREAFYRFERMARAEFEPAKPDDRPIEELRTLILQAFDIWGVPDYPVVVIDVPGTDAGKCIFDGETITIWLPPTRQRPWCALHEAAHAMTMDDAGHGPAFATCCVTMWSELMDWPREQMIAMMDEAGVAHHL